MVRLSRLFAGAGVVLLAITGCAAQSQSDYYAPRPAAYDRRQYGDQIDVSVFYDQLSPYGHWFEYGSYGWCWTPYNTEVGWRPYTDGHWVYSDYGWTWVSDYEWGWAPFHYGRWVFDEDLGWVWVPGTEWAPAWVAWRYDDDWVGWAPLPPGVSWNVDVGLQWGDRDPDRDLDSHAWCFVDRRSILESRLAPRIVPAPRNITLISETRVSVGYGAMDRHPVNQGLDVAFVERGIGHQIPRVHVTDADRPQRSVLQGSSLRVFHPEVQPPAIRKPQAMPLGVPQQIPDAEVSQRRQVNEQRLQSYWQDQRRQLDQVHQRERQQPPPNLSPDQLRQRQDQEKKALDDQIARQRRVMQGRAQHGFQRPPRPDRGNGNGNGNGQGRDRKDGQ